MCPRDPAFAQGTLFLGQRKWSWLQGAFVTRDHLPLPAQQWPPEKVPSRVPFPGHAGDAGQCPLSCGASSEDIVTVIAKACSVLSLCLPLPSVVQHALFLLILTTTLLGRCRYP